LVFPPDAAFAFIEPGGEKDEEGKTKPRSLRHLPHHDGSVTDPKNNDSVLKPQLRNALARLEQTNLSDKDKETARRHLNGHAKELLPTSEAAREAAEKNADLPINSRALNVQQTFQQARTQPGGKFSQEDAGFVREATDSSKVCGACRFYLRDPGGSEIGKCEVVAGPIPWFSTSDLFISALDEARAIRKQENPLLELPTVKGPQLGVVQAHFIGKAVHLDFRFKVSNSLSAGYTINAQRPGAIRDIVDTVDKARRVARGFSPNGDRVFKPMVAPSRVVVQPKDRQEPKNLKLDGKIFAPGEEGASVNEKGIIVDVANPGVEFGLQAPRFHEYFLTKDPKLQGVLFFRRLEESRETGKPFWTMFLSKEFLPSVLKPGADMPPDKHSGIPVSLERVTPAEFRYWEKSGSEARKVRDELVESEFFTKGNIKIVNGEFRRVVNKTYLYEPDKDMEALLINEQEKRRKRSALFKLRDRIPENAICYVQDDLSAIPSMVQKIMEDTEDYLVSVPDTPDTRAEISKLGRPFKMHSMERSRLFVSSVGITKDHDIDWVDYELFDEIFKSDQQIRICKTDEERFVLGIVLEPETIDSQNDVYSGQVIRNTAHDFMEKFQNMGFMHRGLINNAVKILESFIAPTDFIVGGQKVKKGTWLLAIRVVDDELWLKIKRGEITGFSIGGSALRALDRKTS